MSHRPVVFLLMSLVLVLTACGGDDEDSDAPPDEPTPSPTEVVENETPTAESETTPAPEPTPTTVDEQASTPETEPTATATAEPTATEEPAEPEVSTFVEGVSMPSSMVFTGDGRVLFNETWTGTIRVVENGQLLDQPFATLDIVQAEGFTEHGLLGLALHPSFDDNGYVYAFYTVANEQGAPQEQRIVRFTDENNVGTDMEVIVDGLPFGPNCCHNGGRIAFGPDGMLYATLGDNRNADQAQDPQNIAGSILRYMPDGGIPEGNPFGADNPVYAYGLRNPYGLAFHPETGELWAVDNGPNGFDEVNLIQPGANYGWPVVRGIAGNPDFVDPIWATGESNALGITGIEIPTGEGVPNLGGRVIFCGWNDGIGRVLEISEDNQVLNESQLPVSCNLDVAEGPDGALYTSTVEAIFRYGPPVE